MLDGADKQSNPRSADNLALLNRYAPVLRSYCAAGDPVCAGGDVVAEHLNYFELYTDDASSWVVGKIDDTAPLCAIPSSSLIASSSVSTTSSATATGDASVTEGSVLPPSISSAATGLPAETPTAAYTTSVPTTMATYTVSSEATPSPSPNPAECE